MRTVDCDVGDWTETARIRIEAALDAALPAEDAPPITLHLAMRYSVLGGGKRVRPLLCLASAAAIGGAAAGGAGGASAALAPACAVEFIHAYSLIHDDLPALDNDELRRGRPTCHVAFGEAAAILAGDALQTLAFAQLTALPAAVLPAALTELSTAAGTPQGMAAGQAEDLEAQRGGAAAGAAGMVEWIHRRKTAALIRAALVLGGLAAGATPEQFEALRSAGEDLGLAFQIVDDVLDMTASAAALGKSAGKDEAQAKLTWPAVHGIAASRAAAQRLAASAQARLAGLGASAGPLRELAATLVERGC